MSVLLHPNKSLIHLEHYYIEKPRRYGGISFTFINNLQELEKYKADGFVPEDDIPRLQGEAQAKREKFEVDPSKVIRRIQTDWTPLNWREMNNIYSACMRQTTTVDGQVNIDLDVIRFRDQKLKSCLKGWNVKDDSNQDVPVTTQNIDILAPEVAQRLLEDFEKVTEVPEEDLKN